MKGVALLNPLTKSSSAVWTSLFKNAWTTVSAGIRTSAGPVWEWFILLLLVLPWQKSESSFLVTCNNSMKRVLLLHVFLIGMCLTILADTAPWTCLGNTEQAWIGSLAKKVKTFLIGYRSSSALWRIWEYLYKMSFGAKSSLFVNLQQTPSFRKWVCRSGLCGKWWALYITCILSFHTFRKCWAS